MGPTFTTGPFVFGLFAFGESADAPASFKSGKIKHFVFPASKNEVFICLFFKCYNKYRTVDILQRYYCAVRF